MPPAFVAFVTSPIVRGALSGFVTAVAIDIAAFRKWQSYTEARAYDWRLAAWRWVQGAVYGGLTAAGVGAL